MIARHDLSRDSTTIDAMRGVAALLVFLSHADAYNLVSFAPITHIKEKLGQCGVYLFFIISGFLIWRSAMNKLPKVGGHREYVIHRFARIAPLYYVALVFSILIFPYASAFPVDISVYNIWRHLIFSQALAPDVSRAFNPVLWTLTFEAVFYFCVPLLFVFHRTFLLILATAALITWWGMHSNGVFQPFMRLCFLFAIGMTFAQYTVVPTFFATILVTATACILEYAPVSTLTSCSAWALALFCVLASTRYCPQYRVIKWFAFAGLISYSIYIWHYMIIEVAGNTLSGHPIPLLRSRIVRAMVFTAFCLILCWLSYIMIEKPGQTKLRALLAAPDRTTKDQRALDLDHQSRGGDLR
jgi:peptidoglycan/LPS O-acetylase OafA/YrhL